MTSASWHSTTANFSPMAGSASGAKLESTPLAAAFCPDEFTIVELRAVYEAVWGTDLDPRNFHRTVTTASGFVLPTGRRRAQSTGRR